MQERPGQFDLAFLTPAYDTFNHTFLSTILSWEYEVHV